MKITNKNLILSAVFLFTVMELLVPQVTHAGIWDCFTNPFSCTVNSISILINGFLSLFIGLGAIMLRVSLQVNGDVVNLPAVQSGFGITLAVANLGFVLAIIVIAIATILRNQTYGIKQLLFKLVAAAILVNFSLVIAGAILGFSDSLTRYFMQGVVPVESGPVAVAVSYGKFVNGITTSFGPQGVFGPPPNSAELATSECGKLVGNYAKYICGAAAGIIGPAGDLLGPSGFFASTMGALMSAVFLSLILFTFWATSLLLIIRFVYVGILLILAPLAWLLWIFPNTKSNFNKWWGHFIRWAFFPPIVVFFLYLVMLTGSGANRAYLDNKILPTGPIKDNPEAAIIMLTKKISLLPLFEQNIILIALALGGLFAANSLSIMGAGVAMGAAKSVGKGIQGFAFKQGKRGAGTLVPTKIREKLEAGGYRGMPKRMQAGIGGFLRGVKRAGGAGQVDEQAGFARDLVNNDIEAAKRMISGGLGIGGTVSTEKGLAIIRALIDKNKMPGDQKIGNKSIDDFIKNDKLFKSWGSEELHKDLTLYQKGVRPQAAQAAEVLAAKGEDARMVDEAGVVNGVKGEEVRAIDLLRASLDKTTKAFEKGDWKGRNLNHMFADKTLADPTEARLRTELLRSIIRNKPQVLSGAMPKMSQESLQNLSNLFQAGWNSEKNETERSGKSEEDKKILLDRLTRTRKSFETSIARNALGLIWDGDYEGPIPPSAGEETKKT